jgi:hypothetical protein
LTASVGGLFQFKWAMSPISTYGQLSSRADISNLSATPTKPICAKAPASTHGLYNCDNQELAITAGEDVAVAIVRCGSGTFSGPPEEGGFLFRLTIGLRNVDGDWRIAHEHHSVLSAD